MFDRLRSDLRFALRQMFRQPLFAAVTVLTLALGIGANTAIFTVLDAVLLSPLQYPEPDRLVRVYQASAETPDATWFLTVPDAVDLRAGADAFQQLATLYTYREHGRDVTGSGAARRIRVLRISADYFAVYGAAPALGRPFLREEEREEGRLTVLSHWMWQEFADGDPAIIGRSIELDGEAYTVVGVMGPEFHDVVAGRVDAWVPEDLLPGGSKHRGNHYLSMIGRLRPGTTIAEAQAQIDGINQTIVEQSEQVSDDRIYRVDPLLDDVVGTADTMLAVLMGAAGLVLLIACVNVANLFLARSLGRQRELAVRSALGSGRRRLVRQLLTESLVLATIAGVAGVAVATVGVRVLLSMSPDAIARSEEVGFDGRMLVFALAVTLLTTLVCGLVPALRGSRVDVATSLKNSARGIGSGVGARRMRTALIISQVSLALILLVGSGLLLHSFATLQSADLGFRSDRVATFEVHLPDSRYGDPADRIEFHRRLHDRLRGMPGVVAAGAVSKLPSSGHYHEWGFRYETTSGALDWEGAQMRIVEGDYFEVMGIELLAGRTFEPADDRTAPRVMVISETAADIAFPDKDPIGRQFFAADTVRTVVGLVRDVAYDARGSRMAKIYIPHAEYGGDRNWALAQVVRTSGDPVTVLAAAGGELRAMDPQLVLYRADTMHGVLGQEIAQDRFALSLMALFAIVAVLLAAIGIYGVLSYWVGQRTHEIGIRLALGATAGRVLRAFVRQVAWLAGVGILIGLLGAWWLSTLLGSLVYEVDVRDFRVYVVSALILSLVALSAGVLPARRATGVAPANALREE